MKIQFIYIKLYLKTFINHRMDALLSLFNLLLNQIISFLFIHIIYSTTVKINDWTINEIILLYATLLFIKGFGDLFSNNIYSVENYIRTGEFDRFFLKPLRILRQIIMEKIDLTQIINIIIGLTLIVTQLNLIGTTKPFYYITTIYLLFLITGIIINIALKVIFCSIAFWTLTSLPILLAVDNISEFSKYPLEIYPSLVKGVLLTIIPFSIMTYIPVALILDKIAPSILFLVFFSTILLTLSSNLVWKLGIKNYKSGGH